MEERRIVWDETKNAENKRKHGNHNIDNKGWSKAD